MYLYPCGLVLYGKGEHITVEENMGGKFFLVEILHLFTRFKDVTLVYNGVGNYCNHIYKQKFMLALDFITGKFVYIYILAVREQ